MAAPVGCAAAICRSRPDGERPDVPIENIPSGSVDKTAWCMPDTPPIFHNDVTNKNEFLWEPTWEAHSSVSTFPAEGATEVLYLAQDSNTLYRWTGSAYVAVGAAAPSTPHDLSYIWGTVNLDWQNGELQKAMMDGGTTILFPITDPAPPEGRKLVLWLVGCGDNIELDETVKLPSDSSFSGTKALTNGKRYVIQFQFDGTNWMLTSLVGGY